MYLKGCTLLLPLSGRRWGDVCEKGQPCLNAGVALLEEGAEDQEVWGRPSLLEGLVLWSRETSRSGTDLKAPGLRMPHGSALGPDGINASCFFGGN